MFETLAYTAARSGVFASPLPLREACSTAIVEVMGQPIARTCRYDSAAVTSGAAESAPHHAQSAALPQTSSTAPAHRHIPRLDACKRSAARHTNLKKLKKTQKQIWVHAVRGLC
jgi:hypothetical protein